jgi:hypothetical protein
VKIFGEGAEALANGRIIVGTYVRVASALERERADMGRLTGHGFCAADRRPFSRAFLPLASGNALLGVNEGPGSIMA